VRAVAAGSAAVDVESIVGGGGTGATPDLINLFLPLLRGVRWLASIYPILLVEA
jgi:hypothetical protein